MSAEIKAEPMSGIWPILTGRAEKHSATGAGLKAILSRNIAASLARAAVVAAIALALPAYLTHRLPVATYAAWVLILQLAAYVSYFDLGIQIGVSKFVAEYDAKGDREGAGSHASAGLALMLLAGALGVGLTCGLAWQVPRLFPTMPADLSHDVRISLILVGSSLSFGLVCAVFSAVFLGLQRYWIPMMITMVSRAAFAATVIIVVALHGSLVRMGVAVALVNVATGVIQVLMWRSKASFIPVSAKLVDRRTLKAVASFCTLQSIGSFAMLCIAGLDITIVGHFDYGQTAYYSLATLPTNFVLLIISSVLGPLLPASSAMSTHRSPLEMGNLLAKATRYAGIILLFSGLPLMVCGLPILRIWVGPVYAAHTLRYLQILVFANIVRNLCAPYATMISATGRQGAAAASAICEAVVNLGASIYLASRMGALGVAMGTVLGSFVGVAIHFAITMHFTRQAFQISRSRLFLKGILRPGSIALPSLSVAVIWWLGKTGELQLWLLLAWSLASVALAWQFALERNERQDVLRFCRNQIIAWQHAS